MAGPRIILFDLETLPDLSEALRVWPSLSDYPGKTLRATITSIICAGWKVFGEKKVNCINAWDFTEWERNVNDDKKLCIRIHEVLCEADAVITHNGLRFDWKHLQTRFIKHGLDPLPKIPHIDTKALASKNLYTFNNKLGYLGEQFVDDRKLDHEGWDLWVKVHNRCKKSMDKMAKYCKQDVLLLEKIYRVLRPFSNHIPNHNIFSFNYAAGKPVCPKCGSTRLKNKGYRNTQTRSYKRYKCRDCGSYSRTDMKDKLPRSY